jgi:saccharopine dehydrogenase-like NADP-dependent oxidoreductase
MPQVLVLGAGKIGSLVAGLLSAKGQYQVHLADLTLDAPKRLVDELALSTVTPCALDVRRPDTVAAYISSHRFDAVISSLPYFYNPAVAEIARVHQLHYFDLTEDVAVTGRVKAISEGADRAFLPQCGLAPIVHPHSFLRDPYISV